jgi:HPt (histidine-containing phosphotransfer) domain-containing protein
MVIIPLAEPAQETESRPCAETCDQTNWVGITAGATLATAGLLLLAGHRRAGLLAAASGTTLAVLDQQEALRSWWDALPSYVDQVQNLLGQVQDTVNEVAVKREALRRALAR